MGQEGGNLSRPCHMVQCARKCDLGMNNCGENGELKSVLRAQGDGPNDCA